MKIAVDYATVRKDHDFWEAIAAVAKVCGHTLYVVADLDDRDEALLGSPRGAKVHIRKTDAKAAVTMLAEQGVRVDAYMETVEW